MNTLSQQQGFLFIAIFGIALVLITMLFSRSKIWSITSSGFLKAGSNVPWHFGAFSIAASWIWAPALFVSVQKSYELGIPGIFWFTLPNILALVIFAWLGPKIRNLLPNGYTLPDWIKYRFKDKKVHKLYTFVFVWYQVMAVTVQVFVGGLLVSYLTGINHELLIILFALIALSYTLISGMRASIITDFLQMLMILTIGLIIIPWVYKEAGGWEAVSKGLGGLAGKTNPLDPEVTFSFGLVTAIGLISGALSDQQYWQRSFSIKKKHLATSFVLGGILFGLVPLGLSILGFLGANPALSIAMPEGVQLPMIGVEVVNNLLPTSATILFVIMLLAGLTSTLDSGLCAGGSLWAIDMTNFSKKEQEIHTKQITNQPLSEEDESAHKHLEQRIQKRSRLGMIFICLIGVVVALAVKYIPNFGLDKLWWAFNAVATVTVIPTVLSLFWNRISSKGVYYGILLSILGVIAFIYGNAIGNTYVIISATVFVLAASLITNLLFPSKKSFKTS